MTEKSQLEKYGYKVITATTGEKAVETFKDGHAIDLVLMDINLGNGIDGTEAAHLILNDRDVPIIFVSSHTEPEVVEKTEKITSYGYVVKSSSITVLDASIKMAFKLFEANRKITASESKYHALVEGLPGIVYSFSSKRGGLFYSSSTKEILGYSPEQLLADPLLWQNSIHKDDLPRVKEAVAAELPSVNSDGRVILTMSILSLMRTPLCRERSCRPIEKSKPRRLLFPLSRPGNRLRKLPSKKSV